MRTFLISFSTLALAGLALTPAFAATGQHFPMVAATPADESKLCGAKPTTPGTWKCVGQPKGGAAGGAETTNVKLNFRQITWTWVSGGKSAQDSWDAK